MAYLTRTDPTRNINRIYIVEVMPTLLGDWTVMREWGRRGSAGTVRLSSYQRRNEAETAERHTIKRRLQHGVSGARKVARSGGRLMGGTNLAFVFHRPAGFRSPRAAREPAMQHRAVAPVLCH